MRRLLALVVFLVTSFVWALSAYAAAPPDRTTPRRTLDGFLAAAHANDLSAAVAYLDPHVASSSGAATLADELAFVLDHALPVDPSRVSDAPDGTTVVLGTVLLDDEPVPITLARVKLDDGSSAWVVSQATSAIVPALYRAYAPVGWERHLPAFLLRTRFLGGAIYQWIGLLLAIAIAYAIGRIGSALVVKAARGIAKKTTTRWDDEIIEAARRPVRLVGAVAVLKLLVEPLHFAAAVQLVADHVTYTLLVIGVAWFGIRTIGVGSAWVDARIPSDAAHEMKHRGLRTQLAVLERVVGVVVVLFAGAVILLQFDVVRSFGVSLLASAGIASLVLGLAAQKSLAGVIAGVQISITQPIRIGDTVVIEGENGTIEEINLTYVVVHVWDDRRLVVPIGRFLEQPFQNWTKVDPRMVGTVMIPCDFTTPVERVREELTRLCKDHPLWDGRKCSLQVIDATNTGMTLRAVVSSADASANWTLRCDLREKLVFFVHQLEGGKFVPRLRSSAVAS